MTISTIKRKFSFLVIMAVAALLLLTTGTANVMAGGEPGAGCGVGGLKYDPAPYIGTLTVEWVGDVENGELEMLHSQGSVEQSGNSGCSGRIRKIIS